MLTNAPCRRLKIGLLPSSSASWHIKDLEKEIEKSYEQRHAIVDECLPLVQRGSKSLLGSVGKSNLRQMGDYSYTVDDSPRPIKA